MEAWHITRPLGRSRHQGGVVDDRYDYGEIRYLAYGLIDGATYCLAFTDRGGQVRPISLRRAHAKEMRRYVT